MRALVVCGAVIALAVAALGRALTWYRMVSFVTATVPAALCRATHTGNMPQALGFFVVHILLTMVETVGST